MIKPTGNCPPNTKRAFFQTKGLVLKTINEIDMKISTYNSAVGAGSW